MATWAVGDIQGCFRTLHRLLKRIRYSPGDRLWLVGDLVNRGPRSLEVLRWVRDRGDAITTVLGNHDLHLIGRALGARPGKKKDTLDQVLDAPDGEELVTWLRQRPLLHREGDRVLVHAGLLPAWTLETATRVAREVEGILAGPEPEALLRSLAEGDPPDWREDLEDRGRWHAAVQALTLLRTCHEDGRVCDGFSGPPEDAPAGCRPWFDLRDDAVDGVTVVFGHWAALGLRRQPGVLAIDTGCVWGHVLTAVRLDDGTVVQEPFADGA